MDEQTAGSGAPETGGAQAPIATHVAGGDGNLSTRDAARSVIDWRRKSAAPEQPQQQSAPQATAEATESVDETVTAPPQEAPGETQEAEPAALPPIEPPRSWTKEEKERFQSLPRETQEYLANREQERDREIRRSQNEAAEQRKVVETERQQVAQARQQYESALPILLQNLTSQLQGEFSDIQSMADVQKMASEDWPRYIRWDAQQKQIAAVQQEVAAAQQRQQHEWQSQFTDFVTKESAKFVELVPEAANQEQLSKLQASALEVLRDVKFSDQELKGLWQGGNGLSIHDHRFQLILRDAVKWREAQQKAKTVQGNAKPLPPVQRPGVAPNKGAQAQANIQALTTQLDKSSGRNALLAAAKLVAARRTAG
jgi:hypothetical protein